MVNNRFADTGRVERGSVETKKERTGQGEGEMREREVTSSSLRCQCYTIGTSLALNTASKVHTLSVF